MVDNTRKTNSTPINQVQEQTKASEVSSPEIRRVSNTTLALATLGIGLALALIVAGVVTLPLSAIAGVVCIALGVGIGVSAGAHLMLEGRQCLKKAEQTPPPAAIELQTPSRLRSGSAQLTPPQETSGIQSKELKPLSKDDNFGQLLKSQIAEIIIGKNNISRALKDLVLKQLNLYTDGTNRIYYLDVTGNGECFYRCALIALTKNHVYALSDLDRLLVDDVNIFDLFESMAKIDLADTFQIALIETNGVYEDVGLGVTNPSIDIRPYLNCLHEPGLLHQFLFPASQLYKYSAGNLESTQQLQVSLILLLSEIDGSYDPAIVEAWLTSNAFFSGDNIDLIF